MAELVVRSDLALVLGEQARLLLGACDHAHDPLLELLLLDLLLAAAGGEQRRLVDEVREIGAGEAGRPGGECVEVDLRGERLALRVHLEDLAAAVSVGTVDDDLPVEAARAQQRRIEDVRPVRCSDEDDVVLQLEPVHLDEELVQGLLALVVPAAETGAAVAADRVDLVHEDDARSGLLRLLEQVAHAAVRRATVPSATVFALPFPPRGHLRSNTRGSEGERPHRAQGDIWTSPGSVDTGTLRSLRIFFNKSPLVVVR